MGFECHSYDLSLIIYLQCSKFIKINSIRDIVKSLLFTVRRIM